MTKKFHTEKHSKKRHFVGKDQMHSKEKMAMLEPVKKPAVDEKTEHTEPVVEPAKQTSEVKPASMADVASTQPAMRQQTIQFARKKNAFEKLKDKFHQLMSHFKS